MGGILAPDEIREKGIFFLATHRCRLDVAPEKQHFITLKISRLNFTLCTLGGQVASFQSAASTRKARAHGTSHFLPQVEKNDTVIIKD